MPLTFGVLAAAVAASSPPSDDVTPGVLGFLVVAAIGVALVFLLKSMNKQFRKIAPKADGGHGRQRCPRVQARPRRAVRAGNTQVGRPGGSRARNCPSPLVSVGEGAIGSTSCG